MTSSPQQPEGLVLCGLDGSNPLAFLAALGTLRTLSLAWPDRQVKMAWTRSAGAWRPVVQASPTFDEEKTIESLDGRLKTMTKHLALSLGDNLNMPFGDFRKHAIECVGQATPQDRIAADFAAAFACDAICDVQDKTGQKIQDTALRTMSGAGHQHFLATMRHIIEQTTADHLRKALFAPWGYDDPVARLTLRWDPADDSRYALQWRDPSGDPSRKASGGMLGANRLAIEGLPMLVCAPRENHLHTTGFVGRGSRDTFWTWPIWVAPACLGVCRSLLAMPSPQAFDAETARQFREVGVAAVFRSQRITVGKFRNFTPATAVL